MLKKTDSLFLFFAIIISVLCMVFSVSANSPEKANEDEPIYRYQVIGDHSSGIHINGITAECSAILNAKYSTTLSITMELQKLSSGSYSTIKTWTDSRTGTSIGLEGSKVVNILSSYRLKTTFTAGNETVVVFSYP